MDRPQKKQLFATAQWGAEEHLQREHLYYISKLSSQKSPHAFFQNAQGLN